MSERYPEPLTDARTQEAVIAELGARASQPIKVEYGAKYLVEDGAGTKTVIAVDSLPQYAERAVNERTVTNAESFIAYVNRHGDRQTEIWADQTRSRVVGVLDAHADVDHESDRFGHEKHRVTLALEHTPAWKAWVEGQGLKRQIEFAEHVEEYTENVVKPSSAELLEIAQTLQGARKAEFTSGQRLSNGEVQFRYVEDVQGKAGKNGDLTIPEEFELGLAPYVGGSAYKVIAKLRWRLEGGNVLIGYKLIGLDRILEDAFMEMVGDITEGVEFPVLNGRP